MKFGQLIQYNKRNIFIQKSCIKWGRETTSRCLFVFLKKTLHELKANGLQLSFNNISIARNLACNKNELHKTLDHWSRDMLNVDFVEKGLGIFSTPHFVLNFSRKMWLMLYSINWPNFNVSLPSVFGILGNVCIAIVCFPSSDAVNFEINLIFLIKPFFYKTKKTKTKT